jgi:hypothetical protein
MWERVEIVNEGWAAARGKERGLKQVGRNWQEKKRKRKREPREEEEEEKQEKDGGKILPNCPDLLRVERYGSCSLILPPCSSNPELKMMKDP